MNQRVDRLTVLGGGVLGSQIAWHSAYSGKTVTVYDAFGEGLDNCRTAHDTYAAIYQQDVGASAQQVSDTQERITYSLDLAQSVADADLVIEAVPEIPETKIEVYQKMAGLLPERTIVATNSSTLLASQFAEATGRPEKYCALHFANLIWSMNLAEVMAHTGTAEETVVAITRFAIEIGMVPVPIQKEQNGYVINTLLVPLLNAAQTLVANGVSDPEIPETKIEVYQKMADLLPERTIVATNSSTLLASQFAEATGRPEKYCALHFANLIWSMNLAEVMAHPGTAEETVVAITRFAIEIGMVPVPIQKEQNGYVINTLLVPLLNAAQTLVTNGVSDPETIDRTYMIMNRGVERGPFGVIDVVGMKTAFDVLNYWGSESGDAQMTANARYLQENFLDKGLLGLQTGQGYYSYPNPSYESSDFLDVPDVSRAADIARLAFPKR